MDTMIQKYVDAPRWLKYLHLSQENETRMHKNTMKENVIDDGAKIDDFVAIKEETFHHFSGALYNKGEKLVQEMFSNVPSLITKVYNYQLNKEIE